MEKEKAENKRPWRVIAIRVSDYRLVKVAAAQADKPLGEWLAEAIREKIRNKT